MSLEVDIHKLENPSEETYQRIASFLGATFKNEGIGISMIGGDTTLASAHFGANVKCGLKGGEVWVASVKGDGPDKAIACAIWYPPGKEFMDVKDSIPERVQVDAQISPETQKWKSEEFYPIYTGLTARCFGTFAARRNKHYLHILGTDPNYLRKGVARKLILHGISRADANGWETCLETCKDINVVFYKSVGLEALGEALIPSPHGDLLMTVLRRYPPSAPL